MGLETTSLEQSLLVLNEALEKDATRTTLEVEKAEDVEWPRNRAENKEASKEANSSKENADAAIILEEKDPLSPSPTEILQRASHAEESLEAIRDEYANVVGEIVQIFPHLTHTIFHDHVPILDDTESSDEDGNELTQENTKF